MTPVYGTVIVAVVVSVPAGVVPINFLAEMTSIGTLVAFLVVSLGVIILRRREPDLKRGFKVPGYPALPVLSILGCLWIITQLDPITIIAFVVWTAAVMVFYWFYGRKHSELEVGHPVVAAGPDFLSANNGGQSAPEDDRDAATHVKDA
jgi:amino acid transporter